MKGASWTPEQLAGLRTLYPDFEADVVARVIGRDTGSVHRKAHELGITKSAAFQQAYRERQARRSEVDPRVVSSQFKQGLVPWNKGTHFVAGGRSAETRFKPGQPPKNTTLPLGSYRFNKDGTLQQKVTELPGNNSKRWRSVAELVWVATHGPVPAKHIVVFKPGQHTNVLEEITLDRVECISLAENLRRNSWSARYPELAGVVQLKSAITRQVNRIKKHAQEATPA